MIFIDYENIHKNLIKKKQNALGSFFFDKIRVWCNNRKLRILDIKVYCNFDIEDLYLSHHQSKLQEYGLETFHTANKGKNYADLKITSDLLEELYENSNIDGFIIISNDKDMTPLIKIIKRYKEFVYLFTNKDCYDSTLKNFPDELFILEDEVLNIVIPEEAEKEYNKELEKNKKEENKPIENKPEEKIEQKENIQPKKLPSAGTNGILSELILVALIVTGIYAVNSKKRLNSIKRVTNIINGSIRRKNK